MKTVFRALCCGVVVSCLISLAGFYQSCGRIEDSVLRLHIIANSDSEEDQAQKLAVRDEVLRCTEKLFADCTSKEESIICARDNLSLIQNAAKKAADKNGGNYDVTASVTNMSFDTRVYDDFTLPAGKYDALRIVIGEGGGHNWWCVLYPAVCLPCAESNISDSLDDRDATIVTDSDSYQIGFKAVEIIEGLISFFGL